MLRFLLTLMAVFALIIGSTWYWVVAHPMAFLDHEYPNLKAKGTMLDQCDLGTLDILGDSDAMESTAPNQIGPGTRNFAIGGARTLEWLAVTKRILACPNPPKAVALSITFFSINYDPVVFWERSVKFGLLGITQSDLDQLRQVARNDGDVGLFGKPSLLDSEARLKEVLYTIKFPSYFFGALINARFNQRWKDNKKLYGEMLRDRGQLNTAFAPGDWEPLPKTLYNPSAPLQLAVWEEMLDLYQAHNIPVYFISPPYKEQDVKDFSPAFRAKFLAFVEDYEKRYPNFHRLGDLFPSLPNEDFGDLVHTNPTGTAAWSARFKQLLVENHIEH